MVTNDKEAVQVNDNVSNARSLLERYMHYYTRYKGHEDSRSKEKKTRDDIKRKITEISGLLPNSAWVVVDMIELGTETLFRCRKTLQYSYAFAFYLFDESSGEANQKYLKGIRNFTSTQKQLAQQIWEDNVQELENATEKLSKLIELPVEEICFKDDVQKDIRGSTVMLDRRQVALFDILNEELMEDGYSVPKPKSVLASAH
jgi:ariadne-1